MLLRLPRRARFLATLALAAAFLGAFVLFKPAPDAGEPYVFAMSVRAANGNILASPVVVGTPGKKMEVRLMCESDPRLERMSLVLEPLQSSGSGLDYHYELTVPGHVNGACGVVHLTKGVEQEISVGDDGSRRLTFALYAAPLKHPGLTRYLLERRLRLGRSAS